MFDLEKREKAIILILLAILLAGLLLKILQRPNQITDLKVRGFDASTELSINPELSRRVDYSRAAGEQEKVNINEADEERIAQVNGISPSLAKRIVEYRAENGYFRSAEELKKVKGIGNKLLEKIKDRISIE